MSFPSSIPTFEAAQRLQNERFGLPESCLFDDTAVLDIWGNDCAIQKTPKGNILVSTSKKLANDTADDFMAAFEGGGMTDERLEKIKNNMRVVTDSVAGGRLKDIIPKER